MERNQPRAKRELADIEKLVLFHSEPDKYESPDIKPDSVAWKVHEMLLELYAKGFRDARSLMSEVTGNALAQFDAPDSTQKET